MGQFLVAERLAQEANGPGVKFLLPGRVTWNTVPCGTALATVMRPPCDSTIDRQIERPIPIPSAFVVKKASKMRLAFSGATPGPGILHGYESPATVMFFSDRTRTSRSRSSMDDIASAAFRSKLSMTCCS